MRKSTSAISLASASSAPPRTRRVIGSTAARGPSGGPGARPSSISRKDVSLLLSLLPDAGAGASAGGDHEVAEAIHVRVDPGRDDGGGVVLVDDRRAAQVVAGEQRAARVVAGGHGPKLAV